VELLGRQLNMCVSLKFVKEVWIRDKIWNWLAYKWHFIWVTGRDHHGSECVWGKDENWA
jgi:hypothetical protein